VVTHPDDAPVARWLRRHPVVADGAVAVGVFVASLAGLPPTSRSADTLAPSELTTASLVVLAVASSLLIVRRFQPMLVWAIVTVLVLGVVSLLGAQGRGVPVVFVALYTVAAHTGRRRAVLAAAATGVVAFIVVTTRFGLGPDDALGYAAVASILLAGAIGDAVRSNREVVAAAVERAERAESSRDEEARRRVVEERLRIGRELHDVVAHHVAAITVHAGVAEHLLTADPAEATASLRHVRESSTKALEEMHALVDVLRERAPGDGGTTDTVAPAPTLAELDALVDRLRASGAQVTHHRIGSFPELDELTGLHLYRITQEALTNAARHGTGPVDLETRAGADALHLVVRNPVAAPASAPGNGGYGLVGMRERAALVGARLAAGPSPTGQQWVVDVRLPLAPEHG
jgi:signal transduction histidine kinase